ncbi:PAS domain-containing protein [Ohtaekwangia kribbensis]|uniref:PAS domain-containing protein n=1 Tax=Ohtaekwangia kribbensis TaxID=688913 RepID=A0ABW3JWL8_9BACT
MKALSYSIIKKTTLNTLQQQLSLYQSQITSATQFVKAIEQGNLDIQYNNTDEVGDENSLASSLVSMRDQMKKFSSEEKQRNWVTEGLARFVDILRAKNDDLAALTNQVISSLVKYMEANQGALYILDDEDPNNIALELVACYAYNRQKHLNQRFALGEGIIGQVVLEKNTTYLKTIPKDYIRITSGLGQGLPRNLLVVPLKIEERVWGVVEIASFQEIGQHQIEFVEKLGESIASTISAVKGSERTKKLLHESQVQAEQMRSQEEEMRQNLEELAATQEEMQRIIREVQSQEGYLNEVLNASKDSIFTVDRSFQVISFNKAFVGGLAAMGVEPRKGMDILSVFQYGEQRDKQRRYYTRALEGETFDITESFDLGGTQSYFISNYSPLRKENGEVFAAACYAKDVTEMMRARHEAERLAHQAQQANEEMKAQEEELRQNMEELSATQEEMQRILTEVQSQEGYLNEVLNASKDSIFTVDKNLNIISFNKSFAAGIEALGLTPQKGLDVLTIFQEGTERAKQRDYYTRALKGETFDITESFNVGGAQSYYLSNYSPLRRENGEVFAAACYAKDITEMMRARHEAERMAHEAQQANEEMKAQEEELRQNMEELSATQEEMQRILTEVQSKERYVSEILNASAESIFTLDRDFRVVSYNSAFTKGLTEIGIVVEKGFDILSLFGDNEAKKKEHRSFYERAFKGEAYEVNDTIEINGAKSHFLNLYSPIRDDKGTVIEIACFAKNLTEIVNARNEAKDKEVYLNNMLNATSDAILTVDKNLHVVMANDIMLKTFRAQGIPIDVGFHVTRLSKGNEEEQFLLPYKKALAGEVVEMTRSYFEHHYLITYNPLRDAAGEVIGVSLFTKDITSQINLQQQTEKLLAEAQGMKRDLEIRESVFTLTTILSEADVHGTILAVNRKLCEVSKYTEEELIGKPHSIFRHPDMPKELFRVFWETIKKGEVFKGIIKNRAKDGSYYWVDATIVPVKDEAGKIVKYIGARYHIEDSEMALLLYNRQAKRLNLPQLKNGVHVVK